MRTIREISSGGIVYRGRRGIIEVALIRVRGRWCLPKGQVEEGEGMEEAALREVREETGLEGKIVAKLGDITYWYTGKSDAGEAARIFKRVRFYLLHYLKGDVREHDQEVEEASWFPIDEAVQRLTFPTEKETMRKALAAIQEREGQKQDVPLARRG